MVKNTVTGTSSEWQDVAVRGSHTGRRPLPALNRVDALTAGSEQGLESVSGLESFPLCYTAGRHEGARREAKGRTHDGTRRPRRRPPPESQRTPPRIPSDRAAA